MKRTILYLLIVIILTATCAHATSALGEESIVDNNKITSLLSAEMAKNIDSNTKFNVIIFLQDDQGLNNINPLQKAASINTLKTNTKISQSNLVSMLQKQAVAGKAENIQKLYFVNAIAAEVTPDTIQAISKRQDVKQVDIDHILTIDPLDIKNDIFSKLEKISDLPEVQQEPTTKKPKTKDIERSHLGTAWGVDWIEAPDVWSCGITGSGVNVSIIDTGIDATHPDLQDKVVAWKDFSKFIPYNGTYAWYSGTGDNLENTLSRTFDLSGVSSATLEFEGKYDMEYDRSTDGEYHYYDFGYVNVSTDSGVTWDTLAVYQGLSDGYMHEELDLTPYAGLSNVMVQFAYITDETYYYDGWYIDDIRIQQINFFDGAESGTTGWAVTGWDTKDSSVYWPSGSMWYSGTGNYLYNTLEQTFDLSGQTSATLNFSTRYDIEEDYDFGYVQVLTDWGWDDLAVYSGYNDWTDMSIDLTSYIGPEVTIRFLYETDDIDSYEGWYIDNIEITEIGFNDDVESGNTGWVTEGWIIMGPGVPYDDHGHGTHVAGTVAGTGANGLRTGVAPGANLMGVKVCDNSGSCLMSDVIQGIEWSVENGADIVSLSLGMNVLDEKYSDGQLNLSETAIENITVYSDFYDNSPENTATSSSFKPTFIIGEVELYETDHMWGAEGTDLCTLSRTFDLSSVTTATLEFETAYVVSESDIFVGEVQVSTDGSTWDTIAQYSGTSETMDSIWINESLSMDSYAGSSTVTIKFVFEPGRDVPGADGIWVINNIAIPEINFEDDVESGNTGWTLDEWYIYYLNTPLDIANADISLTSPDGTPVLGDEMEWKYSGMVPDNIWIYKYTGTTLLQPGDWKLNIISNSDQTIEYSTILQVGYPSDGTDATSQAIDTAATLGVVPVIAASNEGEYGLYTIGSPGTSANAITVGAIEHMKDSIADFSSRGPVGYGTGQYIKPDVVAPGTNIASTITGGDYVSWSGTSMATPHVSGTAALLLQADPTLTPADIKQKLMDTAIDLGEPGMDTSYGAGRISAYAAVNSTVSLLDCEKQGTYELFAGALIDEIYTPPFIKDQIGDAAGYADIIGVEVNSYESSYDTYMYFNIYTDSKADLSQSCYHFYMDTDKDTATGSNTVISELGIDYYIKIEDTGTSLYKWNSITSDWELTDANIYGYADDSSIFFYLTLSDIDESDLSSFNMNVVLDCLAPDDTLLDRAPDTGYGTYPGMDITIDMMGISWNDSSRLPEQGMNITFDVYRYYDYCEERPPSYSITEITDAQGMAEASVQMKQDNSYYIIISDETGNEVMDYVYVYLDSFSQNQCPFIIPRNKDYQADINSILPIKITIVTPEWEPYNENVTLLFGHQSDDRGNISVELTPVNGTIEYDLDLSSTDIDENYFGDGWGLLPVNILNGTIDDYDCMMLVSYIDIFEDGRYVLELSPDIAMKLPGSTASYLVESYVSNMTCDRPISDELTAGILWVTEVEVKSLGLTPSILYKLNKMQMMLETTGDAENLLTSEEHLQLSELINDSHTNNIGYNITQFQITTDNHGLDTFDVDVSEDAYYGFVSVYGDHDWYEDVSIIIISEKYINLLDPHPTAPESAYYDLYVDARWDSEIVDGIIVPDDNINVRIWLDEYDPLSDEWTEMPGEDIYLYATTGEFSVVTTDEDGYAMVNLTAPLINDAANSTWSERMVQVWAISTLLTPQEQIAVADDSWAYLNVNIPNNYTRSSIEINNSNLDISLEFFNETGFETSNVPTVLNVEKSDGSWYSTKKDLKSTYIDSPTSTWQTSIPLTEYGTYLTAASYEYLDPFYSNSWSRSRSSVTFTPLEITSDIGYEYQVNSEQIITVTVNDLAGLPVEGASVYIVEEEYPYDLDMSMGNSCLYHIDIATTDSTGTASLTAIMPDHETELFYRIGGATTDEIFPHVKSGYISVIDGNIPSITIDPVTSPTNIDSQTVTGTMDSGSVVEVTCPTAAVGNISSTGTTWSVEITGMTEGNNDITATATNTEGFSKSVYAIIVLETIAQVTIDPVTSPTNIDYQTVTGTMENGSVVEVTCPTATVGTINSTNTTWSVDITNMTQGNNNITATATNTEGSSESVNVTIVLNTIAQVTIDPVTSPTNIDFQTVTGTMENGSVVEVTCPTATVGTINSTNTTWSVDITNMTQGNNNITATATNTEGSSESVNVTIVLNTIAQVTIDPVTSPTNIDFQTVTGTMENGSVVEVTCPTATVGTINSTNTTWFVDITNMTQGNNNITATATNTEGSSESVNVTIVLNTIAQVTIDPVTSPTNIDFQTVTGTMENGSVVEVTCPTATVGTINSTNTTWSVDITNMTQGNNNITATATNTEGSSESVNVTIVLNTIAQVTIDPVTSPTNIDYQTVTGTMENGSVVEVTCPTATVGTINSTNTTWSVDITNMTQGNNNITATAIDLLGNTTTANATIEYNSDGPFETEIISIGTATVDVNDTVMVSVSMANATNITNVTLKLVFDPDVVTIINITANPGTPSSIVSSIIGDGNATIKLTNPGITVTDAAPLMDITFQAAEDNGTTVLGLQNIELTNNTGIHAPNTIVNGSIAVRIRGDFNDNNRVDIGDAAKVAFMVAGKEPEDLRADFNDNGRVDIGDAAKINFYLAGKEPEL